MRNKILKNILREAVIVVLALLSSLSIPARAEEALPVSRNAVFSQLDLYANIETIGVIVSGASLPKSAQLMYRQRNESIWHTGHPLMRIDDGRLVSSLFGLSPSTSYDIKVLDGTTEITGSTTTQPNELPYTPSTFVYVNDDASPGGDGSEAAPFQTIQEGVNRATAGTQVLVADGIYREAITFPASGNAENWIQVKAQGSGAILDGSVSITTDWLPYEKKSHVWFTKIGPSAMKYFGRDQKRFYMYDDLPGLLNASGHNKVTITEGWYYEAVTGRLYVRSQDDPSNHSWQMPILTRAFDLDGRDWIWIEGFEMRFYGARTGACGVCTLNASHVVIRKNRIHNIQVGIFINWTGGEDRGNDTRIEYNEIYDPPVNEWPWNAVKSTSMEGTAIVLRGQIGAIVRDNDVHNFFNGIYTGSSATLENPGVAFDADIYNNRIHHISDDALEPEGASINQRFRNNTVDTMLVGISLAPITYGPTWVMRSTYSNFTGRSIKWDRNSDGVVLIYHNTSWTNQENLNLMEMISPVHNAVMRNNIFQGNGYSIEEAQTGSTGHDWNNDNWYTARATPHFKWENIQYATLVQFCSATGLECNGHENPPGLVNPSGGNFSLLQSSPNVDRGVVIPGINDQFTGSAPDIGAFESAFGNPPPVVITPTIVVTPTVEIIPPVIAGILRADPNPTAANIIHFTVTLSNEVTGVDVGDFAITTSANITGASITEVVGSGTTYTVTVNTGTGDGSLRLDLLDHDSIFDLTNIPLGGVGMGNGNFNSGQEYTINKTMPAVVNSLRVDPNPTVADTVRFAVTFSESVSGVDASDFTLVTSGGISGATVTGILLSVGNTYIITVSSWTGNGTIRLDVIDNDSIINSNGHPVGGVGLGNGNFSGGEQYSIDAPLVILITETFTSNGAADGWVLESKEDSNRGGTKNSSEVTFNLGDDVKDRQYRAILQFPTSSLPDNAVITMAILTIKSQGRVGTDPFNTHQNILIDIRRGVFGAPLDLFGINLLQAFAFQSLSSRDAVGMIAANPQGDWYWSLLDASAFPYINLSGVTQLRLRFQVDDNDDRGNDYLKFYSGNYREQVNHPQLLIEYRAP